MEIKNSAEHTYDNGFQPRKVDLKDNYRFYNRNIFFLIFNKLATIFLKGYFSFHRRCVAGVKVYGKKNFKKLKKGAVIIANHIYPIDAFYLVSSFFCKKIYISMLQSNLGFPIVSKIFRFCGAIPIPESRKLFERFESETTVMLNKGKNILVYPEAALVPYSDHIREFKRGAFLFAVKSEAPIVPMVFTFHNRRRKKPAIHMHVLPPYYIEKQASTRDTINKTKDDLQNIMSEFFNSHSDITVTDAVNK